MYGYAYRLTGSVPDAEDLTQQAFLVAQQRLGQLRNPERARGWLFTILRNCFFKSCQKRRPVPAGNLSQNVDSVAMEVPEEAAVSSERLQWALDQLPEMHRKVLLLRYVDELSYAEIAAAIGVSIGTVMSRLFNAKRKLRAILGALTEPLREPVEESP